MLFTQRIGQKPVEKLVQRECMDEDLRNSLWNALSIHYWQTTMRYGEKKHSHLYKLIRHLWLHFFKTPVDNIPVYFNDTVKYLMWWYLEKASWGDAYDFVEFVAKNGPDEIRGNFIITVNSYLIRENSAYRFVSGELAEITSQEEIQAVEAAIDGPYSTVREHLKSALILMNDKSSPDFRNSIKESISSVESLARILTGKDSATLGQALKTIEKNGKLHQALQSAFSSLYGYTNDAEGIRHALLEQSTLTKADARFMLVSCSTFVNYLIELSSESKS